MWLSDAKTTKQSPKSLLTLANRLAVTFLYLQDQATQKCQKHKRINLNPWPLFVSLHFDGNAIDMLRHLWLTRGVMLQVSWHLSDWRGAWVPWDIPNLRGTQCYRYPETSLTGEGLTAVPPYKGAVLVETVCLGRGAVKVFLGTRLHGKEPIRILHFCYEITLQPSRISVYSSKEEFEKVDLNMKKKYRDCLVTKSSRIEGNL